MVCFSSEGTVSTASGAVAAAFCFAGGLGLGGSGVVSRTLKSKCATSPGIVAVGEAVAVVVDAVGAPLERVLGLRVPVDERDGLAARPRVELAVEVRAVDGAVVVVVVAVGAVGVRPLPARRWLRGHPVGAGRGGGDDRESGEGQ